MVTFTKEQKTWVIDLVLKVPIQGSLTTLPETIRKMHVIVEKLQQLPEAEEPETEASEQKPEGSDPPAEDKPRRRRH